MSCSFFGVGVGEQLFAISTEFTKGLRGEEKPTDQGRLKKELPVCSSWVQGHLLRKWDYFSPSLSYCDELNKQCTIF